MPSKALLREFLEENTKDRKMVNGSGDTYDPNIEYYSIDWHCTKDIRWVRNPFVQLDELRWMVLNGIAKGESDFDTASDFRVLPEKWLSEPRKIWIEEIKSYVPDFITNRQFIFDNRYEDSAVLTTGLQSLGQLRECGDEKETKDEWFDRIIEDPRMKYLFQTQYSHLSFVDGKWVRV